MNADWFVMLIKSSYFRKKKDSQQEKSKRVFNFLISFKASFLG